MKRKLNIGFVVRSVILSLIWLALLVVASLFLPIPVLSPIVSRLVVRPLGTLPAPPTINAPQGVLPLGNVGLQEWAVMKDGRQQLRGSGFLLRLKNGEVIGVTTAHSLPDLASLQVLNFVLPSTQQVLATGDTLYGLPGTARNSFDLTIDYVLVRIAGNPNALIPDARGMPQLGERVSLFSGLGDERGERRELQGTVFDVSSQGFWVAMDEDFDPSMMSGSPVLSQHTGQVLGMVIAGMSRGEVLTIGFHPIGSIVQKAEQAKIFPKIFEFAEGR